MIIGIDGNEANIKNRVGVNKYAFEIIKGIHDLISKACEPSERLIVYVYLKDKPLPDMPKETEYFKYKILHGGKIWIFTKLMPYLLKNPEGVDVFFTPSHYVPPFSTVPLVCSIMDLGYLKFSGQFRKYDFWQLKLWSAWSINISKYILTISSATAKDIVRRYPSSRGKVVVTYPGYEDYLTTKTINARELLACKKKYSIVSKAYASKSDYILYLGTLKPSKNVEGLIRAFYALKIPNRDLKLVIAGKKGWLYESIFKLVNELGLEKDVVFTDFVEDKDKYALVKGAKMFVLPSFWEGFGLDVLTAYALGTPVIASNVGSLPEVVGDAGILIDPNNTNSIAEAIVKILNMKKAEYAKLVAKGRMQLKKFSWEKSAKLTLETIRKATNVSR